MESGEAKRMLNLLVELPHSTYTGMDFGCASFSPGSLRVAIGTYRGGFRWAPREIVTLPRGSRNAWSW